MGQDKTTARKPHPEPEPIRSFGEHLLALRLEAGLSVAQAAAAAGMSEAAWSGMEAEAAYPRLRMIRPITNALGVEPHEVL